MLERILDLRRSNRGKNKLQNEKHCNLHLSLNITRMVSLRMGREFMFHENQTISGVVKQPLASQEGLYFMELGFCYIHFILRMDELSSTCTSLVGPKLTGLPSF